MAETLFAGLQPRECGEHRTVGYRAWCFDCNEWCYPGDLACKGCRIPALEARQQQPGRYSFTRPQLIDALAHLEAYPATAGPGQRVFISAESMADALIEALEADRG